MNVPLVQPPTDGFMDIEKLFLRDLFVSIYKCIEDPITRFIIMAHYECGYTQDEISEIICLSQPSVLYRIKKIQKTLRRMREHNKL